jgi:acetate kinase
MADHVVTLNAGSSSIKFGLFATAARLPRLVASGQVDGIGADMWFRARDQERTATTERDLADLPRGDGHRVAIDVILHWIERSFPDARVGAIGHRVVHGGPDFAGPVLVTPEVFARLETFAPLAPLHQPQNLAGIAAATTAFPGVPQVACFDTAFHRGHSFVHDTFALPRRYYENGIRRYGFHGLSYEYIVRRMREIAPLEAAGRMIVAHLGNGASMCAIDGGRSVASTMGLTALDGLPMGTRCGQIDPGVLLYLLQKERLTVEALADLLYEESGLLGLSGVSQDMRELELSADPRCREAIDYFVARIRHELGGLATSLSGLDAVVFTGGIGQHSGRVRALVLDGLGWLGIHVDSEANARDGQIISTPSSRVRVFVLPTDEEAMIADQTIDTAGVARVSAAA